MAKRTNGEGTIRKRNDGRWEARYFDPIDGRQHSIYGKTQKAVSEKLRLTLCKIDEHRDIENVDILVTEWIETLLRPISRNFLSSFVFITKSILSPPAAENFRRLLRGILYHQYKAEAP